MLRKSLCAFGSFCSHLRQGVPTHNVCYTCVCRSAGQRLYFLPNGNSSRSSCHCAPYCVQQLKLKAEKQVNTQKISPANQAKCKERKSKQFPITSPGSWIKLTNTQEGNNIQMLQMHLPHPITTVPDEFSYNDQSKYIYDFIIHNWKIK